MGEGDDSGTEMAGKAWSAAYLLPDEFWLVSVWTCTHGNCAGLQRMCWHVCAHTYVHTVTPQDGTACGQQQANIVFLMWLLCQGYLAFPGRMSTIVWRMRDLFPKQLKAWQRWSTSVPTGISWVGGLVSLTSYLFSGSLNSHSGWNCDPLCLISLQHAPVKDD